MEKICKNCEKEFIVKRNAKGLYCSLLCWLTSKEKADVNRKSFKGKILSKEHRKKMALAKIGTKRSLEARIKSSEFMKGHKWSKETLEKRANSLKGKTRSGQAYQNILNGIAKSYGYKSYAEMPLIDNKDWRGTEWRKIRLIVIKRDNYKCQLCPNTERLQVHHIIPWRDTHDNSPENLITLCIYCHQRIKGKPL
jgi:hypothetical protein